MKEIKSRLSIALLFLLALPTAALAQWQVNERVWSPPRAGNFHVLSHTNWPPIPGISGSIYQDCPVYFVSPGHFLVDDSALVLAQELAQQNGHHQPAAARKRSPRAHKPAKRANLMRRMKTHKPAIPSTSRALLSKSCCCIAPLCLALTCSAQGTMTFTFEGAPRGTTSFVGVYYEAGMSFGAAPGNVTLAGGGIPGYPENGTGYLQAPDGNVDFFFTNSPTKIYFNLLSLDLAAYNTSAPFPATFQVVGYRPMAPSVTNYFTLTTALPGFQTF
jgi:hypothetical protein